MRCRGASHCQHHPKENCFVNHHTDCHSRTPVGRRTAHFRYEAGGRFSLFPHCAAACRTGGVCRSGPPSAGADIDHAAHVYRHRHGWEISVRKHTCQGPKRRFLRHDQQRRCERCGYGVFHDARGHADDAAFVRKHRGWRLPLGRAGAGQGRQLLRHYL